MKNYAPICVFAYKKVEPLRKTIEALQGNKGASESELFVFSDGPKSKVDAEAVNKVRLYLNRLDGFKKTTVIAQQENRGLAKSIINGVSEVLQSHNALIVLEDDLVTSRNFLLFMNQAINTYSRNEKIHSISGFTFPMRVPDDYPYDNYFTRRASSWGWATWRDRWEKVDWSISDYDTFSADSSAKREFNEMGSDMSHMLAKQMKGKLNSWAIRWCYHQFKYNRFTVYPTTSKILNIGFGEKATNTKGSNKRYATSLDTSGKNDFEFDPDPELNEFFIKQFVAKFSISTRIYEMVKAYLGI